MDGKKQMYGAMMVILRYKNRISLLLKIGFKYFSFKEHAPAIRFIKNLARKRLSTNFINSLLIVLNREWIKYLKEICIPSIATFALSIKFTITLIYYFTLQLKRHICLLQLMLIDNL
jgi:hypothetical protein